ncbi:MAG: ferrous iron transport protein B [Eubacteriaceae bacterium]|nr:ferrous iron transport protein B [Eubacteriaceae bacterium]
MRVGLIGNQNCGKTTLFNQITGSNQKVGNFPGVTVSLSIGKALEHKDMEIIDLPGIYSLSPYTSEEILTRDFLINESPDAIINIVDATNIERNLYLTLQLIELSIPMVLALNMMDEVQANNGTIDVEMISEMLGIPAVPIAAIHNQGVSELLQTVADIAESRKVPEKTDFCTGAVHRAIHAVQHVIEDHALIGSVPTRFAATKLLEGDNLMAERLKLSENEIDLIEHAAAEMEEETLADREAAIIEMRYAFIEGVCSATVVKARESKEYIRSAKIDSVLTSRAWAFPAFFGIMLFVFWITFGVVGAALSSLLSAAFAGFSSFAKSALSRYGLNYIVLALITEGALTGISAVLSFLPTIITLFFFLSILEDSGYMARVAYIMDKPLRKIGLSGKSIVPMLMGFGCTVPAVMATRTLPSERGRMITVLITPFMSCSAKLPIYALFASAFFPNSVALVMASLYFFGAALGIAAGYIMNKTAFSGSPIPFVMELPNYRFPSAKTVMRLLWDKAKDFIQRAFSIVFLATLAIWILQSFDSRLNYTLDSSESMLSSIGHYASIVLGPAGFSDWRAASALITGFSAKEAVISSLAVLLGSQEGNAGAALHTMFTPLSAVSFLVFSLLYTPCIAAVAAAGRELRGVKDAFLVAAAQTGIAWLMAVIVYQAGRLFTNGAY